MRHRSLSAFGLVMCAGIVAAQPTPKEDSPVGMDLVWAFKIPMRDGVRLNATVFKPAG